MSFNLVITLFFLLSVILLRFWIVFWKALPSSNDDVPALYSPRFRLKFPIIALV